MRIYLGEGLFPSFEDDQMVFFEKGIEFGDWKENRKVSVDVPMSEVSCVSNNRLIVRLFNTMGRCSRTSSYRKVVRLQILEIQRTIPNCLTILRNVPPTSANLIVVLTRYMPKRKEVHLKKLIKGGDDAHKEPEIQVKKSSVLV
jgi:hypothetical protein